MDEYYWFINQLRNKDKESYFHIPMWYGISRLLIVKRCIKNIDYNINRLIYKDIPYSKAKEWFLNIFLFWKKAYHFEKSSNQ